MSDETTDPLPLLGVCAAPWTPSPNRVESRLQTWSRAARHTSHPHLVYAKAGWLRYGDWLGTGNLANRYKVFRSFGKARAFAKSLSLESAQEWRELAKTGRLPADMPRDPYTVYESDKRWKGMGDWLGTGVVSSRDKDFRPFGSARRYARTRGLESSTEWHQYASSERRPIDIPSAPHSYYRENGWVGWPDWLGFDPNKSRRRHWRPFPAARRLARSLKLTSAKDWRVYASRRPKMCQRTRIRRIGTLVGVVGGTG